MALDSTNRRNSEAANPVAAVLNFTAHFLTRDVRAAVLRAGLHPGFGFLHAMDDDKEPCVYDVVEAFRAPLAEGLTVYLFNNRILNQADFKIENGMARILPSAQLKTVKAYEAWLARPVVNPATKAKTTWRSLNSP